MRKTAVYVQTATMFATACMLFVHSGDPAFLVWVIASPWLAYLEYATSWADD